MAIITDVKKLRPELLEMTVAELERRRNEIDMAIADKYREAEISAKRELADKANEHIDAVVAGVKFLHDSGILVEKITAAFTFSSGTFNPSAILRNVTAEQLVTKEPGTRRARDPNAPKRRRRTKAEIEALKASGEYKARRR